MKVALVQPNYRRGAATGGYVFMANPPLGLCYLAAVLRENNIEVKIFDANAFDYTPELELLKKWGHAYDSEGFSDYDSFALLKKLDSLG